MGNQVLATTLTGSFRNADGSAVANGRLLLRLRVPAVTKTSPQQVVNNTVVCSLDAAGAVSGTCSIQDNANLTPTEYYVATLYDSNSNRLWSQNWYITGASVDVGTLQQTTIGISFPNPVFQSTTSAQSVQSAMTFTGNVTFSNPVLVNALNNILFVDGVKYTTIQAAVTAAATGATVYVPPAYTDTLSTTITIPKSLRLVVDGASLTVNAAVAAFTLSANDVEISGTRGASITLAAANASGVRVGTGSWSNLTVRGLKIVGSGVLADDQEGILFFNHGGTLAGIKILENTISGTTLGIYIEAATSPEIIRDVLIQGNTLKSIVGSGAGVGYGIATPNRTATTAQKGFVRILGNYLEDVGRHSIYQSMGRGVVIANNVIKDHALSSSGSARTAIAVGRGEDIIVSGNLILDNRGEGGIEVFGQNDFPPDSKLARNIVVSGNIIRDSNVNGPDIIIGTSAPATEGNPEDVTVQGNTIRKSAINNYMLDIRAGKRLSVLGNILDNQGVAASAINIEGTGETAGTANYTDDLVLQSNIVLMSGGGDAALRFGSAARTSGIKVSVLNNRFNSGIAFFFSGGAQADSNIAVFGTEPTFGANGLDRTKLLAIDSASPIKALRFLATQGTALVAGDFALSAGWGTGATVTAVTGTDQATQFTVTAAGTPAANPTVTLTFKDGTWTNAPICQASMVDGTGTFVQLKTVPSATNVVITYQGTPVAASTYVIANSCMGR